MPVYNKEAKARVMPSKLYRASIKPLVRVFGAIPKGLIISEVFSMEDTDIQALLERTWALAARALSGKPYQATYSPWVERAIIARGPLPKSAAVEAAKRNLPTE